ncbi:phage minor tail protein [Escherichia coli]|nr:phage minor tail protein [Escherichia coli]
MKHTDIRAAVLDALELHEHGATLFDGRPVVFDEEDFPAVAVYLTDAEYTGEELDADTWRATLHIEVFFTSTGTGFGAGFVDGKPDLSGDDCDPGTGRPDYHDGYAGL